jgi:hypothetical protein
MNFLVILVKSGIALATATATLLAITHYKSSLLQIRHHKHHAW